MVDLRRVAETRVIGGEPVTARLLFEASTHTPRPSLLAGPVCANDRQREAAVNLGINSLADLVEHVPVGHENRRGQRLASLRDGDEASVEVTLLSIVVRPTRRRNFKLVEARIADSSGERKAVWFNQAYLATKLAPGTSLRLFGIVKGNALQVREHTVLGQAEAAADERHSIAAPVPGNAITPVYPGTEGFKSARIRELIAEHRGIERELVDPLPPRLLARERLCSRADALAALHFPVDSEAIEPARRRLAFEELLLQQLSLGLRRTRRSVAHDAIELKPVGSLVDPWLQRLPFELTGDQNHAVAAIGADLDSDEPMQRLLMGEVGSGKTVCALAAMLRAAENACQAALMAPTETLAEQHFATLNAMLPEVPIALLTGSTPAARRRETLARLGSGELPMIVGTHALIEPDVEFRALALAVVDEQHRFGVRQRAALDAKTLAGRTPHILHMTATPIPRTQALINFGDLDTTVIRELPRGRQPVETRVVGDAQREQAYEAVRARLREGRQAYVVCPLVEQSDQLEARAATVEAERLALDQFRDFKVDLLHGQMSSKDKAAAMAGFANGETDVLVATSVIEVGIDVSNAVMMIIEDADRFGISQLHQLRGRIGRGEHSSTCFLFGSPKSYRLKSLARERDGFELARIDLTLRGSGEELGTRQSGLPRFRFARLPDDAELVEKARLAIEQILTADPELSLPHNALLRSAVVARYGTDLDSIPA